MLLAYALSFTDGMILLLLLPDSKADFGLSGTRLGLLGGLPFALFYATLGIPIARLSDRFNRKCTILYSVVFFSLMTVLCGLPADSVYYNARTMTAMPIKARASTATRR